MRSGSFTIPSMRPIGCCTGVLTLRERHEGLASDAVSRLRSVPSGYRADALLAMSRELRDGMQRMLSPGISRCRTLHFLRRRYRDSAYPPTNGDGVDDEGAGAPIDRRVSKWNTNGEVPSLYRSAARAEGCNRGEG